MSAYMPVECPVVQLKVVVRGTSVDSFRSHRDNHGSSVRPGFFCKGETPITLVEVGCDSKVRRDWWADDLQFDAWKRRFELI